MLAVDVACAAEGEGLVFVGHKYCENKVSCRVAVGDVDGKDELAIVVCERAASPARGR